MTALDEPPVAVADRSGARGDGRLATLYHRAPTLLIGSLLLLVIAVLCLGAQFFLPGPLDASPAEALEPPSGAHLFGTDEVGRDVFSRVAAGGQQSLLLALISVAVGLLGGVVIGGLIPVIGPRADRVAVLVIDSLLSFPPVLIALVMVSGIGTGTLPSGLAVGAGWVPYFARFIRGQVLVTSQRTFVIASRASGRRTPGILMHHILPHSLGPIAVVTAFALSGSIVLVAGLGFLGLGVEPPQAEWGTMLSTAKSYWSIAPWMVVFPGAALVMASVGANLMGDGLQELYDPHNPLLAGRGT